MKPKILTILGTRPEIIRLSRVIPRLDEISEHRVLHTGQNFDANLSDVFFQQLHLRAPDWVLDCRGSLAQQLSVMYQAVEQVIRDFAPHAVLILGDTNSGLCALVCERMGVPVYHMEAGNRCRDLRVPEELNRRMIDSISSVNLPYTELSRQNLLREGADPGRVLVTGNPILEVIQHYSQSSQHSTILERMDLQPGEYVVATVHRAENVDDPVVLDNIMQALEDLSQQQPVIFSCHPRTQQRLGQRRFHGNLRVVQPMGFFDWIKLAQHSSLAVTDSGTVQEEMCLFRVPTVTVRRTTERPETVSCGSNIVSGVSLQGIQRSLLAAITMPRSWPIPDEYQRTNVSEVVVNIIMGGLSWNS